MKDLLRKEIKRKIGNDFFVDNLKSLYVFSWDKKVESLLDKIDRRDISKVMKKVPRNRAINNREDIIKIIEYVISNRNNNI